MLAKIWKKLLLAVLLIACLFNIVTKLVSKMSFEQELGATVEYLEENKK